MKRCKIIHLNDGTSKIITNGDGHFMEEYTWAESAIEEYLNKGYVVKHIIPEFTPGTIKEGNLTFYKGGFTVYLEKED